ncbi:MAG: DUF3307 domain-containing protein [Clostridia bacterium]|nr:DUF3307 domain-containing protein [Clostridia bacterium]
MNKIFTVILMIFLHIVDDYYLQGWLASAKQKSWWEDNAPEEMYKHDYICALLMHGFSWSFMIMLPIAYMESFDVTVWFAVSLIGNALIHLIVDNAKANKKAINLITDQCIHILQIIITALVCL